MSLLKRFTHGVVWTVLGTAGARLFSLAVAVALARLLGQKVFGELAMLQSTFGLGSVLAGFGLGLTATKHLAELRHKDPRRCPGWRLPFFRLPTWLSSSGWGPLCFWSRRCWVCTPAVSQVSWTSGLSPALTWVRGWPASP